MKIDDIQIEAAAKNHLWANIARDGEAFVLTDFRHPGTLRIEWDGDILWISHSSGEQVGISADPPLAPILDVYLPGVLTYFAVGGEKPEYPAGVLVEGEELPADGTTEREQVIAARKGQRRTRRVSTATTACRSSPTSTNSLIGDTYPSPTTAPL